MTGKQREARLASAARKAHVVTRHDVNRLLARVQSDAGHVGHGKHQGRKHEVVEPVSPAHLRGRHAHGHRESQRKPPEPHAEDHEGQKAQPEGRRGGEQVARAKGHAVKGAALSYPHRDPEHKPAGTGKQPGGEHERGRAREAFPHDLRHGSSEA